MNHVNQKTVIGLGVATLIAIVAAVAINAGKAPSVETTEASKPLLPDLREHLNDVKSVALVGAESKPIGTLEKSDKGWVLKEKNYPADAAKLREFLLKLSDAVLLEGKTDNEKRYADLGVEDVKNAGAKGVLVRIDGLAKPAAVILGNTSQKGGGTYVRRDGEKQSWLARGNLTLEKTATAWLDKALADIPATRVKEVVVIKPDGKALRVYKDAATDTNYKIADVPKGREASSEFVANGIGTTLAGLRFDDVLAAGEAAPPSDGKVHKAHFVTFDGIVVDLVGWKKDDKDYVQFSASFDEKLADASIQAAQAKAKADWDAAQKDAADKAAKDAAAKPADAAAAPAADAAKPAPVPPPAVSDPAKDREDRLAATQKELAELKARFDGWTYVLPTYKVAGFDKSMDDMLKPLDDKNAKSPAKPAPPIKPAAALPGQSPTPGGH